MNYEVLPDILYHYTSLESLALILKNQTLRLNPLTKMDDLQERRIADIKHAGASVFVSSWTEESKESIPMWNMYTDMRSGVRIGMSRNPFVHDHCIRHQLDEANRRVREAKDKGAALSMHVEYDELPYSILEVDSLLTRVEYVGMEELDLLEPAIHFFDGVAHHIETRKLGRHKNKYWEFQKEWRYICSSGVNLIPQNQQTPEYIDLPIAPVEFEHMEIVRSPRMSPGNRLLLELLVERYCPKAIVRDSELQNLY